MKYWLSLIAAVLVGAYPAVAQDTETINVTVFSASGRSVFLDKGSAVGIEVEMRVRFYPPGGSAVEGIVRAVSTNNARVDLPPGLDIPPIGSKGEVDVPIQPEKAGRAIADTEPGIPEHPPWSYEEEGERTEEMPLLFPPFRQRPEDRPREWDGRAYINFLYSRDMDPAGDNDTLALRKGVWLEGTNLLGHGGRFLYAGELDHRSSFNALSPDESDTVYRLDRLSYAIGGEEYSGYRAEGGRFYSIYLPELGLVDGLETVLQFENGLRAGFGGGAYPLPFNSRQWGQDLGFHTFLDYTNDDDRYVKATVGYQKTWHNGTPDRDQLVGRTNVEVSDTLWVYGSFRADIYTDSDTIKGSGVELTELWTQVRYTPDRRKGATLSYSHNEWPELLRAEFSDLPIELLTDGQVDRVSASVWRRVRDNLRVTVRGNGWVDQDDAGGGGEVAFDWYDEADKWPSVYGALFFTVGGVNAGAGLRADLRKSFGDFDTSFGYEFFGYDAGTTVSATGTLFRHVVRGSVSLSRGNWYYSFTADGFLGDAEQGFTFGVYTVYRF